MGMVEEARPAVQAFVERLLIGGTPTQQAVTEARPSAAILGQIAVPQAVPALEAHVQRTLSSDRSLELPASHVPTDLAVVLAGLLDDDNVLSRRFPGGYRRLAPWLLPLVPWACVRIEAPDGSERIDLDGFVYVQGQVWWIPKAHRVVRSMPGAR